MIRKRELLVLLGIILIINGCSTAYVRIPRKNIQPSISTEVRDEILKLYSNDAVERTYAVIALGNMGSIATPAVPFLIQTLDDPTPLMKGSYKLDEGIETSSSVLYPVRDSSISTPGKEAQEALKKITGRNFSSQKEWQEWWEENKGEFGKRK